MLIIERVNELFQKTGKTPADLTRHLGLSAGQISNWQKRKTDPPARFICDICKFFGVSPAYLLGMEDPSARPADVSENERDLLNIMARFTDSRLQAKFVGRAEALADDMLRRAAIEKGKKNLEAQSAAAR